MALTDLLSDGAPIPAGTAPVNKTTTTSSPDWYTNYAKDLLAGQGVVSTRPYEPPPMPRVAGFTDTERAGMAATTAASSSAAAPIAAGLSVANSLIGMSGLSAAQPLLDAAGRPVYEGISNYMNPYNDAVTNRIAELGARTLREKLLPEISDRFVRSGQFGGSRQSEMIGRGLRDIYESTLAEQNKALQSGYSGALTSSAEDLKRRAELARTTGDLGTAAVTSGLDVAKGLTDIGKTGQETALAGAAAVTGVGAAERSMDQRNLDVSLADWLKSQGYPQDQIDAALKTFAGIGAVSGAVPQGKTEVGIQPTSYPQQYGQSPLDTALSTGSTAIGIYKDLKDAGII